MGITSCYYLWYWRWAFAGKLRLGSVQLGNSIGVLVVSLLLGQQHFSINTDALNLGFMLFIFVLVWKRVLTFSIFFRDGKII